MTERTQLWGTLVAHYLRFPLPHPGLRSITLAQWAHESRWGSSALALLHYNFGGLNYRPRMRRHALPVRYTSSDGPGTYCHFRDIDSFIAGYWQFVGHKRYSGWEGFAERPVDYIRFLATSGYAADPEYVDKVLAQHDKVLAELPALDTSSP